MTGLSQILDLMRQGRWNEAHDLVQHDTSSLGNWLHGMLHIQEGDLEDAEYWYGKANRNFRSRGTLDDEIALFEVALHE